MTDHTVRRAQVADVARQAARIQAGEADQIVRLQPGIEMLGGTVIGWLGDVVADDQATGCGRCAFQIFDIRADVADVRKSEGDDLPGIGRVSQNFLVAGDRGVEADFADVAAGGADSPAPKHRSIAQNQDGGRALRFLRRALYGRGGGRIHRRVRPFPNLVRIRPRRPSRT